MADPLISPHARQRCEEMGISTKVAKRIWRNPTITRPGNPGTDRRFVWSSVEPAYAIVLGEDQDTGRDLVITVVYYDTERSYDRATRLPQDPRGTLEVARETTEESPCLPSTTTRSTSTPSTPSAASRSRN